MFLSGRRMRKRNGVNAALGTQDMLQTELEPGGDPDKDDSGRHLSWTPVKVREIAGHPM